ncbi:MAG: HesA/MoeB/ThiF family protein [Sphingobacteriales bacterium]|nr:HesA/MoeB/ThiF family protein [Sphingobacteriales bacterium]MBI3717682.1 HesA/MoeB/ThiF family protein [Sphingobacteriales bacterium]
MDKQISYERYHRQLILKDFGEAAQQKLLQTKVLVIGAGGLGCPALQYLTAAGVGTIGIADDDIVSLSNLHRQVLYGVNDIGKAKAETATIKLKQLNPEINFHIHHFRITNDNAVEIIKQYEIIIDGSDNFATRYLVNDACVLLDKTLVYGAVSQYEGQVAVFNHKSHSDSPAVNYRDLFPVPPGKNEILNCAEAGVLGVLPGIIGSMMANETIKLITGTGKPLVNSLLTYDSRNNQLFEIELLPKQETRSLIPADIETFNNNNYEELCAADSSFEIDTAIFSELLESENIIVVDVREKDEVPLVNEFAHVKIPLSRLTEFTGEFKAETIVLFCQSGKRSLQGAKQLSAVLDKDQKIFSLKDGIVKWKQQKQQV